jgi:REP element-mobilizing transposase RayT
MPPSPIYTAENCTAAYQLLWSFSLFWREPMNSDDWRKPLSQQTEGDDVRLLRHRFARDGHSLFLVSTKPSVSPTEIARSIKGRLQYLVRDQRPKAFQRNYCIRSIGSTRRDKLEAYLGSQVEHHPMADPRVAEQFAKYQICNPAVDLSQARFSHHAKFWYNLHISLVHEQRYREVDDRVWTKVCKMINMSSQKKGHLLSRAGILPDHLHMTIGCGLQESPQEIAVAYLNNLSSHSALGDAEAPFSHSKFFIRSQSLSESGFFQSQVRLDGWRTMYTPFRPCLFSIPTSTSPRSCVQV